MIPIWGQAPFSTPRNRSAGIRARRDGERASLHEGRGSRNEDRAPRNDDRIPRDRRRDAGASPERGQPQFARQVMNAEHVWSLLQSVSAASSTATGSALSDEAVCAGQSLHEGRGGLANGGALGRAGGVARTAPALVQRVGAVRRHPGRVVLEARLLAGQGPAGPRRRARAAGPARRARAACTPAALAPPVPVVAAVELVVEVLPVEEVAGAPPALELAPPPVPLEVDELQAPVTRAAPRMVKARMEERSMRVPFRACAHAAEWTATIGSLCRLVIPRRTSRSCSLARRPAATTFDGPPLGEQARLSLPPER